MVRVTQNPTTANFPDLVGNMAKPLLLWTNFKVQRGHVCPVWEFSEEAVIPSGYILDGSILSLTLSLPSLPVNYSGQLTLKTSFKLFVG